jgi:hypothetical protein
VWGRNGGGAALQKLTVYRATAGYGSSYHLRFDSDLEPHVDESR